MVTDVMAYKVHQFGLSDVGLVRERNEDVWAALPDNTFFVLADGMGGHQAGDIAARKVVEVLCELVKTKISLSQRERSVKSVGALLNKAIVKANRAIYRMGCSDPELKGMGTTVCCIYAHADGIVYAHVGDSRIYRLREGKLQQLTKDHSLLSELSELGQINEHQAADFLYRNIITQAVGVEPTVNPSVAFSEVEQDDIFLMCSDGVTDLLVHEEIEQIIEKAASIEEAGKMLIEVSKARGGHDNITVVLLQLEECFEKDLSR